MSSDTLRRQRTTDKEYRWAGGSGDGGSRYADGGQCLTRGHAKFRRSTFQKGQKSGNSKCKR